MKKVSKALALILSVILIMSAFAGCGKKEQKTGGKFTYWVAMPAAATETLTSYNDLLYYQEVSKATGIDVEFIHPTLGSLGSEAFQILLSTGEYPDMIEYSWRGYAGGPDQAIKDGVIISLNDYLEEYAPNYYSYMEGDKAADNNNLYKAQAISSEGNYYGFANLAIGTYRGFGGFIIRDDKLKEWGLDIPVTIDDWTEVLKTAKANGFKAPLTGRQNLFQYGTTDMFNTAWKVGKGFYLDENDQVKFGPFETQYKDYILKMAEWMKAGLIDPDYVTNDYNSVEGYMTNGSSIATHGYVGSGIGKLLPAMADKDPNYSLAACPYPVMKDGEMPLFQEMSSEVRDNTVAISTSCGEDRYKDAIKWCDYLFSEEGMELKFFGVEGDTYTKETREDGVHYVYTDKVTDHEKIGAHSLEAALYHFMRPGNGPGFSEHPDYLDGFYPYQQQKDAIRIWNTNSEEAKKHVLPPLTFTSEEASKKAEIEAKHKSNLEAAISNAVLGKISIAEYDKQIQQIKETGFNDLLKIYSEAYTRYKKLIEK